MGYDQGGPAKGQWSSLKIIYPYLRLWTKVPLVLFNFIKSPLSFLCYALLVRNSAFPVNIILESHRF